MGAMQRGDVLRALAEQRDGKIVVATMTALDAWRTLSPSNLNMSCTGFMGGASGLGLGLALSQPGLKVLVLDGDGSLLMQLGSLATIAGAEPHNLYHFLFHNGVYEVSGSQPIPAEGKIDFAAMARAAGYRSSHRFDDLEDFRTSITTLLDEQGPVFIELAIVPGGETLKGGGRPSPIAEEAKTLRAALTTGS
ncbi:MAG: thiamine pyrophosphate-dependent enzyme [Dehalococcoidia bacterium]